MPKSSETRCHGRTGMTDAERTPWFRCGIDDPERPGLYEIGVPRADGRCPELCMGRWTGRRWVAAGSVTPSQGWGDCWRGLLAPQAVPA